MEKLHYSTPSAQYTLYRPSNRHPGQPTTVFLHGGPGLNTYVERQLVAKEFASLNPLWLDLLGGGESPAVSPDSITWENQIEDLGRILQDVADAPVNLIAHCFGAQVAHSLLKRFPKIARRIAFVAPAEDIPSVFKRIFRRAMELGRLKLQGDELRQFESLMAVPSESFRSEHLLQALGFVPKIRDLNEIYWHDSGAYAKYARELARMPMHPEAFFRLQSEQLGLPAPDFSVYSGIPTITIVGAQDPIAPPPVVQEIYSRAFPASPFIEIENSGHWPQFERTTALLSTLREFFGAEKSTREMVRRSHQEETPPASL